MSNPSVFFESAYDRGTPTATTTETGYAVANLFDWRPYTYWKGTGTGDQYVTSADWINPRVCTTLGIIGHDLKTQNATISVECSNDNFATDITEALAGFVPSDDRLIYREFTGIAKRYWRLKISGYTAAPFIGVLVIGSFLSFPHGVRNGGFDPTSQKLISSVQRSQNGNILGSAVKYKQLTISPSWRGLHTSWFDANAFKNLIWPHISQLKPFFWAWDYENHPDEVFFVSLVSGFTKNSPYIGGGYRDFSLEMEGMIEE